MMKGTVKTMNNGPVVNKSTDEIQKNDPVDFEKTSTTELKNNLVVDKKATVEKGTEEKKTSVLDAKNIFVVINKNKCNKKSIAASGKVIEFDNEGKAFVEYIDAMHFKQIAGYEVKEK